MVVHVVNVDTMANLKRQVNTQWKRLGRKGSRIPEHWKTPIAKLVSTILLDKTGFVFKTKKEETIARKLIKSVNEHAESFTKTADKPVYQLKDMDKQLLANHFHQLGNDLIHSAEENGFGSEAALGVWKDIGDKARETYKLLKINGKEMTPSQQSAHKYYYILEYEIAALNKVLPLAVKLQVDGKKKLQLIVFIGLLIIAAAILVYSQKKIYRFARTQFGKIMDTWRRFRGRPAIHDTLNKLETSGRMSSPGTNKEMSIDEALRAIEMGNGFRTRSPPNSRTSSYRGSRAGSSSPVTKKSPKQKFKWIEFHVEKPTIPLKPTPKTTRRR